MARPCPVAPARLPTLQSLREHLDALHQHHQRVIWCAVTGSWRVADRRLEGDVREAIGHIMHGGHGIVTGGALGVDFWATDTALQLDPSASRIRIFLPTALRDYVAHYQRRASEGVITRRQAMALAEQLWRVRRADARALVTLDHNGVVEQSTYFERNTCVVAAADVVIAFHVNESAGVADTVAKADAQGLPVYVQRYSLPAAVAGESH